MDDRAIKEELLVYLELNTTGLGARIAITN